MTFCFNHQTNIFTLFIKTFYSVWSGQGNAESYFFNTFYKDVWGYMASLLYDVFEFEKLSVFKYSNFLACLGIQISFNKKWKDF